jgi:perosamine synthetase
MNKVGPLASFNTIGRDETGSALHAMDFYPLSGFLGGELKSGRYVSGLERVWCDAFGCTHAIAVNSATSGLLAACHAIDVTNHNVVVSPYTMSATAAAPKFLGADVEFADIDANYCLDPHQVAKHFTGFDNPKAVIATNLFGHPAQLNTLAQLAHANDAYLIEDNAQAPFAKEGSAYAGTVGDIGVFSLNVHKHIQSGEGGVVVTDNDDFAHSIRMFINHGEMAGGPIGLNLRMTEVTAAIAVSQLSRGQEIVQSRVDLAEQLIDGLKGNPLVTIQPVREGCRSVYYVLPMEVHPSVKRDWVVQELGKMGVPLVPGYVAPLYWLPAFKEDRYGLRCPITERLHKESLAYFEICAYSPTDEQVKRIIEAFSRVADYATKPTMEAVAGAQGRP